MIFAITISGRDTLGKIAGGPTNLQFVFDMWLNRASDWRLSMAQKYGWLGQSTSIAAAVKASGTSTAREASDVTSLGTYGANLEGVLHLLLHGRLSRDKGKREPETRLNSYFVNRGGQRDQRYGVKYYLELCSTTLHYQIFEHFIILHYLHLFSTIILLMISYLWVGILVLGLG